MDGLPITIKRKVYDIALVGHFAKDIIVTPDSETMSPGGSVYYGALAAKNVGFKVCTVIKMNKQDYHLTKPLCDRGIDIFFKPSAETTGIRNIYRDQTLERRDCYPLGFAGKTVLADLPDIDTKIWFLGPLFVGEINEEFILGLRRKFIGTIALDVQGFVRVNKGRAIEYEDWPRKKELLQYIDFLKTDAAEAEILTGESYPDRAAKIINGFGCKEVMCTFSKGIIISTPEKQYFEPYSFRFIKARTGRGDTASATYAAYRIEHGIEEALKFSAACVSLKLEQSGALCGNIADVLERIKETQS